MNNLQNFPCLPLFIKKMWGQMLQKKNPSDLAENMYQFAKSSKPGKCVVGESAGTREPKRKDKR
jgi:hypothetical protein